MLALPLREDFSPLRRGFSALLRDLPARWRNVGLFQLRRAHPRSWGANPHAAATRASRRGAGGLPAGRVDRVDVSHGGKIGTIGPFQANQRAVQRGRARLIEKIGTIGPFQADQAFSVALSKRD